MVIKVVAMIFFSTEARHFRVSGPFLADGNNTQSCGFISSLIMSFDMVSKQNMPF